MAGRNVAPAPTAKMFRNLRACLVCSIIKPHDVFRKEGCPNCDAFLQLTGSDEAIQECTSTVFEGVMNMVNPEESWVAKWQRLQSYVSGLYAVKVVGIVSAT